MNFFLRHISHDGSTELNSEAKEPQSNNRNQNFSCKSCFEVSIQNLPMDLLNQIREFLSVEELFLSRTICKTLVDVSKVRVARIILKPSNLSQRLELIKTSKVKLKIIEFAKIQQSKVFSCCNGFSRIEKYFKISENNSSLESFFRFEVWCLKAICLQKLLC